MSTLRSALISSAICIGLFSSCADECPEPDVDQLNGLFLQFAQDGASGSFTAEELDETFVIRFQEADFDSFLFPVDTLFLQEAIDAEGRLLITRGRPEFDMEGPPYYTEFKYLFKSLSDDWQVRLQEIQLEGSYTDDEQCDYVNSLKTFFLNDDSIDATASISYVEVRKD